VARYWVSVHTNRLTVHGRRESLVLRTTDGRKLNLFLGRHNEILRIRRQQSNINATIGRLSSILPALLEMKKLEAKMKLGKYYSALKIIQLIRHEHLENCRQVNRNCTTLSKNENLVSLLENYGLEIFKLQIRNIKNI